MKNATAMDFKMILTGFLIAGFFVEFAKSYLFGVA